MILDLMPTSEGCQISIWMSVSNDILPKPSSLRPSPQACMSLAGTLDGPITQSKLKSANMRGQVVIVRDKLVPLNMPGSKPHENDISLYWLVHRDPCHGSLESLYNMGSRIS